MTRFSFGPFFFKGLTLLVHGLFASKLAFGAPTQPTPALPPSSAKKVNVEPIKERYWLPVDSLELGVVQNRVYSKAWKFNIEPMIASYSGDAFVSALAYGAQVGFHFGEYLGVHLLFWKIKSDFNEVQSTLLKTTQAVSLNGQATGADANFWQSLMGPELSFSFLYGKLSLLNKAILHFDLYALAGFGTLKGITGATVTNQNNSASPFWLGAGQQIYVNQWFTLKFDFRYFLYQEKMFARNSINSGQYLFTRSTSAPSFSFGLNFLLPP